MFSVASKDYFNWSYEIDCDAFLVNYEEMSQTLRVNIMRMSLSAQHVPLEYIIADATCQLRRLNSPH